MVVPVVVPPELKQRPDLLPDQYSVFEMVDSMVMPNVEHLEKLDSLIGPRASVAVEDPLATRIVVFEAEKLGSSAAVVTVDSSAVLNVAHLKEAGPSTESLAAVETVDSLIAQNVEQLGEADSWVASHSLIVATDPSVVQAGVPSEIEELEPVPSAVAVDSSATPISDLFELEVTASLEKVDFSRPSVVDPLVLQTKEMVELLILVGGGWCSVQQRLADFEEELAVLAVAASTIQLINSVQITTTKSS
jgi:hypothetical protein